MSATALPRIGFDIGGTKIAGAIFDQAGATVAEMRAETPRTFDQTIDSLAALTSALAERGGGLPARVGLCMPGQISRDGEILACVNLPWLVGRALTASLGAALGRPVAVGNDGNCFALSEAQDGAGRGAATVFGVVLGTGVGAGLVVDGRIVIGANALAGEWGHTRFPFNPAVDPEPQACPCGRIGCVEPMLRARALVDDYQRLGGRRADNAPDVVARLSDDTVASNALSAYGDRLARALADVIHLIDPDVIVIGGGMSRVTALFDSLPSDLARYAVGRIDRTRITAARYGAESGVRGAAWL